METPEISAVDLQNKITNHCEDQKLKYAFMF